jgi:hypothetical protein
MYVFHICYHVLIYLDVIKIQAKKDSYSIGLKQALIVTF